MLLFNALIKSVFGVTFFLLPFSGLSLFTAVSGLLGLYLMLGALFDFMLCLERALNSFPPKTSSPPFDPQNPA